MSAKTREILRGKTVRIYPPCGTPKRKLTPTKFRNLAEDSVFYCLRVGPMALRKVGILDAMYVNANEAPSIARASRLVAVNPHENVFEATDGLTLRLYNFR